MTAGRCAIQPGRRCPTVVPDADPDHGRSGIYKGLEVARDGGIPLNFVALFVRGTIASALAGFAAIYGLLRYLRTHSFLPFAIYRFVVGAAVIVIFSTGLP